MRSVRNAVIPVLFLLAACVTQEPVTPKTTDAETKKPEPEQVETAEPVEPAQDGATRRVRRLARKTRHAPQQAGLTPAERASIESNCPSGQPVRDPSFGHGPGKLVARPGYALHHSSVDFIPLWVCEGIKKQQVQGPLRRPKPEPFAPDPLLPKGSRAELSDYKGSGFDRGHMAPSADQTSDAQLQADTYFLSNMAPQQGVNFNQHIWAELEMKSRDWIIAAGKGHILTGPIFWDPAEDDPTTADGVIEYSVIGKNSVAVPTHFYKIVVVPAGAGKLRTIAFVMENRKHPKPYDFKDYIVAIDWIEQQTGLDFMPELDPLEQQRLESTPATLWP